MRERKAQGLILAVPHNRCPSTIHYTGSVRMLLPRLAASPTGSQQQVMPDDHSELVPPLPIPNRTVKRLHADDSADSRVKVGNRQAPPLYQTPVSEPR